MKNLINFLIFQVVWFAAVEGAARESMWLGPVAVLAGVAAHLAMLARGERGRELRYLVLVGVAGTLADSALKAIGATTYPTSAAWEYAIVPPWITSLWVAFATLPRFSLRWLAGRSSLAALFGAVGGPLSFYFGTRFGSVAVGSSAWLTWSALTLEYALATPLLLRWAPAGAAGCTDPSAGASRLARSY